MNKNALVFAILYLKLYLKLEHLMALKVILIHCILPLTFHLIKGISFFLLTFIVGNTVAFGSRK